MIRDDIAEKVFVALVAKGDDPNAYSLARKSFEFAKAFQEVCKEELNAAMPVFSFEGSDSSTLSVGSMDDSFVLSSFSDDIVISFGNQDYGNNDWKLNLS